MLARILPIFALVVLCVLGYWLYSQGTLEQIIRPTVVAVEAKRNLFEGQEIRASSIEVKDVSVARVEPGMITFPKGTNVSEVVKAVSGQVISKNVSRGALLTSSMFGKSNGLVVLQATDDIMEGDSLSLANLKAVTLQGAPQEGVVVFDSIEDATAYIGKAYGLTAGQMIPAGTELTINDTSGSSSDVFVVKAVRDFSRSEPLNMNGLETFEVKSKDVPSGAVTFQTRGAAEVFIASSGKYILPTSVGQGEVIVADMLSAGKGDVAVSVDDLPRTLTELDAYMKAYPDRAMFLGNTTYVGTHLLQEGDRVDVWVEEGRTEGDFGQINLVRLDKGILVRRAQDTSSLSKEPDQEKKMGTEAVEEEAAETEYLWVVMDPDVKKRFDAAKGSDRIAFTVQETEKMVDLLGNGASCLNGKCGVSRSASNDLEVLVSKLSPSADSEMTETENSQDPLSVMDGVSPALEQSLRINGYDSFEKIATWTDEEIAAITIKLDISQNLALYIRQQAKILHTSAQDAARDLGFEEAPQN